MDNSCLNCTYAKWNRTTNGKLHPNQTGQCTYLIKIEIPKAYYFIGGGSSIGGGYIQRNKPCLDCPTFQRV